MFSILNNKAKEIICENIKSQLKQIYPIAGKCRYNYVCHINAFNDAKKKGQKKIVAGFYMYNDSPCIHFYNIDSGGEITDNTLGQCTYQFQHYIFDSFDVTNMSIYDLEKEFDAIRKRVAKGLPWYVRLLSNYRA
jgi:hypothetical protein